jgi:ferritin
MSKSAQEHIAHINELIDGDITLRDYFAAQILNGHMSNSFEDERELKDIAKWAYKFADAMLKERDAGK